MIKLVQLNEDLEHLSDELKDRVEVALNDTEAQVALEVDDKKEEVKKDNKVAVDATNELAKETNADGKASEIFESLNEAAVDELAMHELKEEVANYIYEFYLAGVDDNIAHAVHASIPSYNIDWCNEEGDNFVAEGVESKKHELARKIADALFTNAPRELGESLTEGFKGLAREINKEFLKDMKEWDNAKVYANEDGLNLSEVSADSDLIKKIEKFVKAKGYKAKYTSDDGFLAINESLNEDDIGNSGEMVGEAEAMEEPEDFGIASAIADLIKRSWENIDQLNSYLATFESAPEGLKTALNSMVEDNMIHVGLLENALKEVDPKAENL